ncbi:MAG: type IV toxin-antitoxin system AbiEi family antitoxin domain-containing protein [Planctomycetes bacterium]|nr:type IV toxin-antitoxin system AbiEi family antitoxin domain-containing protein [Planctomycetota bacterium]
MDRKRCEAVLRKASRTSNGLLRTAELLRAGLHPRDLYALRDAGELEVVSRGIYRFADAPPLADPDLVTVAARVPKAVVALISALHFHRLTSEIPHEVSFALPKGTARPKLEWPPVRVYWFSGSMYDSGIEVHERDGVKVRVYEPAKTIADCFRFRNRIGTDVALDALRTALVEHRLTPAQIVRAARSARVETIVRPYLEAMQ